jgi:hypothetical protein
MEKRIKIDAGLSTYVEKLFFEYNAGTKLLRYLASEDNIKQEYLDKYFEDTKNKGIELEIAKKEVSAQYMPKDMCVKRYTFDFDNCEIVYVGGDCHE